MTVVKELQARLQQQAAVVELGQRALAGTDLATLMHEAVELVARTLAVGYCGVLELLPNRTGLLLRAGVGWKDGYVGHVTVGAGSDSPAGYTLLSNQPVIVDDVRTETRFRAPPLLHDHGIISGLSVIIPGVSERFGVLGAYTARRRRFSLDDINFLQSIAHVLAAAIDRMRAEATMRTSRDQLSIILEGVADGITVQDPTGGLVFANDAAARLIGYPSAQTLLDTPVQHIMQQFELRDESGRPLSPHDLPGRRALQGERGAEAVVRFCRVATGEERTSIVKAAPIVDVQGQVTLAINIFHDITERVQAEQHQRFLAEVSALLATSLDYTTTLHHVAQLAVPHLADWCSVHSVEADGAIQCLAVVHRDPEKLALAEKYQRFYPVQRDTPYGVAEVIRTGAPRCVTTISETMLEAIAQDAEHLRLLRALGLRSAMIVPLIARGRILGTLSFASAESGRRYDERQLAFAEEVALRAAFAVDNARLYQERQQAVAALQRSSKRLQILRDLDQAILAAESAPAVAYAALQHIQRLIPCDRASVKLFDQTQQEATILAVLVQGTTRVERGNRLSIAGLWYLPTLRRGGMHIEADLRTIPSLPAWLQDLVQEGIRAFLSVPLLTQQRLIGSLNLGSTRAGTFVAEHGEIALEVANQVAIALEQTRLVQEVRAGNERLHTLSRRLMEVQEYERRYLARELHDEIGQALTGLKLGLESAMSAPPDSMHERLGAAREGVQEIMDRIHDLSLDLRPGMLDDLGLLPALLWHFERYTAQTQVRVHFTHRGVERRFAPTLETAVYRIVQEALTNSARHAGVHAVHVHLRADEEVLRVEVVDHGHGFDPHDPRIGKASSGLAGMQERVTLLHGTFTIDAAIGRGTTISAAFPIDQDDSTHGGGTA